jgi:hypothetical protein
MAMPAELLVRPGRQDHLVVADLVAPGGAGRSFGARPPISRLVLDAPLAVARPHFAEDARAAGLPLAIDPLTFLLQGETDPEHAWTRLPYAASGALTAGQLAERRLRQELVSRTVGFQIANGATVIVPPYFQATSPADPWFDVSLACLTDAADYLRAIDARLPLTPVLTGRLDRFARPAHWVAGIDRFADTALAAGSQAVAMQLGPAGKPSDNYAKVLHLFQAAQHLRRPGLAVHAWRQGAYGPALVAAGLQGYETGISAGESTDLSSMARNRRPSPPPEPDQEDVRRGGGGGAVYLAQLGRSVPREVVDVLHANLATRALIVCDDATVCCPNGLDSTLGAGRRAHAVRSRARYLAEIDRMPAQANWRLHKIAQDAQAGAHLIGVTNSVLVAAGLRPLRATSLESLAATAQHLRADRSAVA